MGKITKTSPRRERNNGVYIAVENEEHVIKLGAVNHEGVEADHG